MLSEDKTLVFISALLYKLHYHVYDHSSPKEGNLDFQPMGSWHVHLRLPGATGHSCMTFLPMLLCPKDHFGHLIGRLLVLFPDVLIVLPSSHKEK